MRKEKDSEAAIGGRRKRTTRRNNKHAVVPAEDLVRRPEFATAAPNELRTAHITYVDTDEGLLYLLASFVLDVYPGRLVGWAMERAT